VNHESIIFIVVKNTQQLLLFMVYDVDIDV